MYLLEVLNSEFDSYELVPASVAGIEVYEEFNGQLVQVA